MGRWWEEFQPGDEWLTSERTIAEADVLAFAKLSGDENPLHTDVEYCRDLGLPGLVPQTNFVIAAVSGLIANLGLFDRTSIGLVGLTWRVLSQVSTGDTIACKVRVAEVSPVDVGAGRVVRSVSVLNQRGEVVHEGSQEVLVRRRPPPVFWGS